MKLPVRDRDRVARILAHQEADRVPFDAGGSASYLLGDLGLPPDVCTMYIEGDFKHVELDIPTPPRKALQAYLGDVPEAAELTVWGVAYWGLKSVEGYHAGSRYIHPLAEVDSIPELEHYPWPNFNDPRCTAGLAERVQTAKQDGYTVVGQMSQTILEAAYVMRGVEQLMADFYERPDYVRRLFAKLAERRVIEARTLAAAGVDVLRIGDDIATQEALMVSPSMYREMIKPHHAAVITAARRVNPDIHVMYHSDGNLTELLQDLIGIGVTAINPAQPECMDLVQLKREFGRDLTFWGCMPVQSLFEDGSEEDVVAYLRHLMHGVAGRGGLVVQFVNTLVTPRVEANIRAFYRSFHKVMRYA